MYKERFPGTYDDYVKRKSDPNIRYALGDQYHTLFQFTFYRTGQLYSFDWGQGEPTFHSWSRYFDRSGKLVGILGPRVEWDGREVSGETFYRLAKELLQVDPTVKPFNGKKE